jgi:hypothetical protein
MDFVAVEMADFDMMLLLLGYSKNFAINTALF